MSGDRFVPVASVSMSSVRAAAPSGWVVALLELRDRNVGSVESFSQR